LGLIALGAAFIAGLVAYNWWQERKIRRDMVRRFDGPIDDVLMENSASGNDTDVYQEDEYLEPVAAVDEGDFQEPPLAEPVETEDILEDDLREPYVDEAAFVDSDESVALGENEPEVLLADQVAEVEIPVATEQQAVASTPDIPAPASETLAQQPAVHTITRPTTPLPSAVDTIIDEVAVLTLAESVAGSSIRSSLNPMADFGKPVRWFGWSQDAWLPLTREFEQREFSVIVGALQLADRSGPIQADGLLSFQDQVEHLSTELGATLSWYEPRETLRYASTLDQFCIEVDVTVTLHITAGIEGPFAGTKLRSLAEASGLKLKEDGRFHQMNEVGETLYTLSNADQRPLTEESLRTATLHDMVLMLDVPRVGKGAEVFRQMAMFGSRLETTLNARLTDANRRALNDPQIEQIRSQIQAIHGKLQERHITPGGASALRLFS
jgi:hypothetical protein